MEGMEYIFSRTTKSYLRYESGFNSVGPLKNNMGCLSESQPEYD